MKEVPSMQYDSIEEVLTNPRLDYYISHGFKHLLVTNKEFDGLYFFTLNNANGKLTSEQKAICFIDGNLFFTDASPSGLSATIVYPIDDLISKKTKSVISKFIDDEVIEETDLLASLNTKAGIDYVFDMFPDLVQEGRNIGWRSLLKKERNRLITSGLFYLSVDLSTIEDIDSRSEGRRPAKNVRPVLDFVADYTVIDIETTGIDPEEHEITELAAMRVRNHQIDSTFQILVNPQRTIPPEVVELTHITDAMVAGQPTLSEVINVFKDFIGNDILVGHNIFGFDATFINSKIPSAPITNKVIDTMWVARKVLKNATSFKLSAVCECLGVEPGNAHRALSDVETTYHCYEKMAEYAKSKNISIESLRYRNWKASDIKPSEDSGVIEKPLEGKTFVITGELDYLERKTAFQMIVDRGGIVKDGVTLKTDFLVLGECDGSTSKKIKALEMQRNGHRIKIINCDEFFELIEFRP